MNKPDMVELDLDTLEKVNGGATFDIFDPERNTENRNREIMERQKKQGSDVKRENDGGEKTKNEWGAGNLNFLNI